MDYLFRCTECQKITLVSMSIRNYTTDGHKCPYCGALLEHIINNTIIDRTKTLLTSKEIKGDMHGD